MSGTCILMLNINDFIFNKDFIFHEGSQTLCFQICISQSSSQLFEYICLYLKNIYSEVIIFPIFHNLCLKLSVLFQFLVIEPRHIGS